MNPYSAVCPGARAPFHGAFVTVTVVVPLNVPLHPCWTVAPDRPNVVRHDESAVAPALTVTAPWNPPGHEPTTVKVATHVPVGFVVGDAVGVGDGVLVGVGVGVGVTVGVGVGVGVEVGWVPKIFAVTAVALMPFAPSKIRVPHEVFWAGLKPVTMSRYSTPPPLPDHDQP